MTQVSRPTALTQRSSRATPRPKITRKSMPSQSYSWIMKATYRNQHNRRSVFLVSGPRLISERGSLSRKLRALTTTLAPAMSFSETNRCPLSASKVRMGRVWSRYLPQSKNLRYSSAPTPPVGKNSAPHSTSRPTWPTISLEQNLSALCQHVENPSTTGTTCPSTWGCTTTTAPSNAHRSVERASGPKATWWTTSDATML